LLEESHVAQLADPGAGSGSIEALTDTIAGAAWQRFQAICDLPPAALLTPDHPIYADIAAAAANAPDRVIIGVTKHAPPAPVAPMRAALAPPQTAPLPPARASTPFEA
ncbi:MAG: methylmalonyl-CoA mutase family protein, partial [Pseudomonadota bacterium]